MRLYSRLRKAVEGLIGGKESGCKKWIEAGKRNFHVEELARVEDPVQMAPFNAPMRLTLARVIELARERQAAAEADLRIMQTDPKLVQQVIESLRKATYLKKTDVDDQWARVAVDLFIGSLRRAQAWQSACNRTCGHANAADLCRSDKTTRRSLSRGDASHDLFHNSH